MSDNVTRREFIGVAGAAAGGMLLAGAEGQAQAAETPKKLKIIAVACSRRQGGSTAGGLKIALEAAKAVAPERIETELIELAGKQLQAQVAAKLEVPPGQTDDFLPVAEKIGGPQVAGLIIGTPVYFSSMSSVCKDFIERLGMFRETFSLSNVVGGVLAIGSARNGGQEVTIMSVQATLHAHEMVVVGAGRKTTRFGACLWANAEGGVEEGTNRAAAADLGRRVAEVALAMARSA